MLNIKRARTVNLVLTLLGALLFASMFFYITTAPDDFDRRVQDFAISKVQNSVDNTLSGIADSDTANRASEFAGRISGRLQSKVDDMRDSLADGMDVFIADVLAAACKLDCDRRDDARRAVRDYYESSILRHSVALERIQHLIEGEYDDVMQELRRDLSIFTGSSALVLTFAAMLAMFRGRAATHLLPISTVLTLSTLLMVVWYVFGQDWVMTILYSDYWGWTYLILLGGLSLLLIDIAANKARITSVVFNSVGNGLGASLSFSPC